MLRAYRYKQLRCYGVPVPVPIPGYTHVGTRVPGAVLQYMYSILTYFEHARSFPVVVGSMNTRVLPGSFAIVLESHVSESRVHVYSHGHIYWHEYMCTA